jgi:hypothetical protein
MATSYRTNTMARTTKFRTMAEIRTMSRRTFIVRCCIFVVRYVVVVVCSSTRRTTHRTTKIQRRTIKVRQISYDVIVLRRTVRQLVAILSYFDVNFTIVR